MNFRRTQTATGPKRAGAEFATVQPLRFVAVGAVKCRGTVRRRVPLVRAVGVVVLLGTWTSVALVDNAAAAGNGTPTTLPGPAPNQSQINATQSQVAQVESTLAQEEQQTSVLDDKYNNAEQNLQNAQNQVQTIQASLVHARSTVSTDKRLVAHDAVAAYVYGTPETGFTSYFSTSATLSQARNQYTNSIVGNLTQDELALQRSEARLQGEETQEQNAAAQAQQQAAQAKSLAQANEAEASTTKATLSQVQGQLAQEVAQAAIVEAQQEAAAAARAASAAAQQQAAAAAATAATLAGIVGGSASGAAATDAANQASGATGPVGGSSTGSAAGMAAVQAAVSQLGVPYVFGGEDPGVGFDCSGLVQWAWAQAGVSIPRTTETQWPSLPQVSLDALQPGDLLFYYNLDGDNQVDHVVMYTGSGPYGTDTVIQAPFTGSTVSYSPIFTTGLIGAARP
jgi:cell wall-associated NlpC family hydrolase